MGGSRMSSAAAMSACAGTSKVLAHLMFGMTVLTASQLMRLIVPPHLVRLLSFGHHGEPHFSKDLRPNAPEVPTKIPNRRLCQR